MDNQIFSVKTSCSWCHEMNEMTGDPVYCWNCGHRGDVPRMECDCQKCQSGRIS